MVRSENAAVSDDPSSRSLNPTADPTKKTPSDCVRAPKSTTPLPALAA
jgi:hypothetical protein